MRKLIEELQTEIERRDLKEAALEGLFLALQIVKAHNLWYDVTELPPRDELEPGFSIDLMISDGENYRLGYYVFESNSWVMHSYFKKPVTHWTYLPEQPK